jgi:hypothetical protein
MQPESSDGFASVGTVLPKEEAVLLPGGLFVISGALWRGCEGVTAAAGDAQTGRSGIVAVEIFHRDRRTTLRIGLMSVE